VGYASNDASYDASPHASSDVGYASHDASYDASHAPSDVGSLWHASYDASHDASHAPSDVGYGYASHGPVHASHAPSLVEAHVLNWWWRQIVASNREEADIFTT